MRRRMLVLDRDGVLVADTGHVWTTADVTLLPRAAEAIARASRLGWIVVTCSNQAAVGRGKMTMQNLEAISQLIYSEVERNGGRISKMYHCTHRSEDKCECRKPKPLMVNVALSDFNIAPQDAWGVGDKDSDMAAFKAAGIHSVRVRDPNSPMQYEVTDNGDTFETLGSLSEAIDRISEHVYWVDITAEGAVKVGWLDRYCPGCGQRHQLPPHAQKFFCAKCREVSVLNLTESEADEIIQRRARA